jgi:hypothetical protein
MTAMARTIQINVQIDNLPDVVTAQPGGQQSRRRFVGVRVSASITRTDAERAKREDRDWLLPWNWKQAGSTLPWNPVDVNSWAAWTIKDANTLGGPAKFTPSRSSDATSGIPDLFKNQRDRTLDELVSPFDPLSLETPTAPVSVRTVFGYVEGFTTLPAPLAEMHSVWTCLELDKDCGDLDVVVVPRFDLPALTSGDPAIAYREGANEPVFSNGDWTLKYAPPGGNAPAATVLLANACVRRVQPAKDEGERIMLKKQFLIQGAQGWGQASGDDWMATLGSRIAQILDPARLISEALEQVMAKIPEALAATRDPQDPDQKTYKDLYEYLLNPDQNYGNRTLLRRALASVYWLVLSPAARATASAIPIPVAIARGGATQEQRGLLLNLTVRQAALAVRPDFANALDVWSDERVCALAGISRDDASKEASPGQDTPKSVYTPDDARKWLISWWAGSPVPSSPELLLGSTPVPLLRTSGRCWDIGVKKLVADDTVQSGLLDLSVLADASPSSIDIDLKLPRPVAGAKIVANLKFGDSAVADASVTGELAAGDSTTTLTISRDVAPATWLFSLRFGQRKMPDVVIAHDPALQRHAYLELSLQSPQAGQTMPVSCNALPEGVVERLLANTPSQALRDHAAFLYASPFIRYILAGQHPDGTPAAGTPLEKIVEVLKETWVDASLLLAREPIDAVIKNDLLLKSLFDKAIARAADNAKAAAATLVPPAQDLTAGRGVTVKAAPIVFPIDQPQPIDEKEDLWSMFAGMGVLAGRSNDSRSWPADDVWHSLNVAEMHIFDPAIDKTAAIDFGTGVTNATLVRDAPYDPVPVPVGEVGGVRGASVTYSNRTLVGEMMHDPLHEQPDSARARKRTQAYAFPPFLDPPRPDRGHVKLPSLCFGKRYFFLPYLIGHAGALPVCLRQDPLIPTKMRVKVDSFIRADGTCIDRAKVNDNRDGTFTSNEDGMQVFQVGKTIRVSQTQLEDDLPADLPIKPPTDPKSNAVVRQVDYLRTTPVSAPRILDGISGTLLPGIPEGVPPLASEIPIAPAPMTLRPGETVLFYRNKEATEGVLGFDSAASQPRALQIDIGGLPAGSTLGNGDALPARPSVHVDIFGRNTKGEWFSLRVATIDANRWPEIASLGVRLTLGAHGVALLHEEEPDAFVERPARFAMPRPARSGEEMRISTAEVDMSTWRSFGIGLSSDSANIVDAYLFPPVASVGRAQLDVDQDCQIPDARLVPPGETAHQRRVIHVLDGIVPAAKKPGTMTFWLRRPDVEFATYERWINWTMTQAVTQALNRAHDRLVLDDKQPGDDLTLDDPAVERLMVECVQLFPERKTFGRRFIDGAEWSEEKAFENPFRTSKDDPGRSAQFSVQVAATEGYMPDTKRGLVKSMNVMAGRVYELRFYGAVPEAKQSVADATPDARFGMGVWQGLLRHVDTSAPADRRAFRLGAPLTLTIEVSTAEMPPLANTFDPLDIRRAIRADQTDVAETRLPLEYVSDPGVPGNGPSARRMNYQLLRYVSGVALLNQRWGWRGRTLPALPDLSSLTELSPTTDQACRISDAGTRNFEDIAFVDRRDDDIGVIDEGRLQLAHVLPPPVGSKQTEMPTMFVKDLQYRGGANWWRFALRATSRYAAMRPDADLVRYSHRVPHSNAAQWHTLLVTDRDTGRVPKRPGLMLVLPLTECLLSDSGVPPLLAIFSEPMFPDFHIGDGLEASLDYARHPLPDVPVIWADAAEADLASQLAQKMKETEAAYISDPRSDAREAAMFEARAEFADLAWSRLEAITAVQETGAQADFDAAQRALAAQPPNPAGAADKIKLDEATRNRDITQEVLKRATDRHVLAKQQSDDVHTAIQQAKAGKTVTQAWKSVEPADLQRFWPQIGPDPVLTGAGHDGVPVPIRLDGPLGYTFDRETEAPKFGRSGFVVTPVPQTDGASVTPGIAPWTLARLRFRRLEAIETTKDRWVAVTGQNLLLRWTGVETLDPNTTPEPQGIHEGLVVDFPALNTGTATCAVVQVAEGTRGDAPWTARHIRIVAQLNPDAVSITLDSDLGAAGSFAAQMMPAGVARLRIVLSQRDPPEDSAHPYEPVVDVCVRMLIDDGLEGGATRSQAGAWLTVACLPLLAGGKKFQPGDPVYIKVNPSLDLRVLADWPQGMQPRAYGVRLTAFTAPQWCQFTQDVSTFEVTTKEGVVRAACPVTELAMEVAVADGQPQRPVLRMRRDSVGPVDLSALRWLPARPDSQLEGEVALIVTRYVRDAFDRERETPVAIYRIVAGDPFATHDVVRIWPAAKQGQQDTIDLKGRGRARLMTLMRWHGTPPRGGGAAPSEPPMTLQDYLGTIDEIGMEADDAKGRILGISAAIDIN